MIGTPFDIRFWIYPGQNPASSRGAWGQEVDASAYVRQPGSDGGQMIRYTFGRQDEGNQIDAGTLSLTLDNRDGRFSVKNIFSPYWGLLSRNTPCTLATVASKDTFARTVAAGGWGTNEYQQNWGVSTGVETDFRVDGSSARATIPTGNNARMGLVGGADFQDGDVQLTVTATATATGASWGAGPMLRYKDSSNYIIVTCEFNTDATVTLKIRKIVAGVSTTVATVAVSGTYASSDKYTVRAQADGQVVRAKCWKTSGSQPAFWNTFATLSSAAEVAAQGNQVGIYTARFNGNTNTGTDLIQVDDWLVLGFEFTGTVPKWPLDWDMKGDNCWAAIEAAGPFRRLNQGKRYLLSPLTRQLSAQPYVGYWTLEDASNATTLANYSLNGSPALMSDCTPAGAEGPPGGGTAVVFDLPNSSIRGTAQRFTSTVGGSTGFSFMWLMKLTALPATKTLICQLGGRGSVTQWSISMDSSNTYVEGRSSDGTLVVNLVNALPTANITFTNWIAWQLETEVSGGNNLVACIKHEVGKTDYYAQSTTLIGDTTVMGVNRFALGGSDLDGCAWAHAWMGQNTLPFVADTFSLVSNGYAGELFSARVVRIAQEAGIQVAVEPGVSDPAGVQRKTDALSVLQSCEAGEYGILYEQGTGTGFRPRRNRYNVAQLFTISTASGQIASPPSAVYDDQRLANSWTVSRDDGSYAVARDATSIALEGEQPKSDTINVQSDSVLQGHADLRKYLGTRDGLRWPSVVLDFARNPNLLKYWRAAKYGFRFGVTTGRTQVAGAEPDLIAEGASVELHPYGWRVTLNCSDATVWDPGRWSATAPAKYSKWGPSTATLDVAINAAATSLTINGGGEAWVTGAVTLDLIIGGEIIGVTNLASAGGGKYTATGLTRGKNTSGIGKDQTAGSAIKLAPKYQGRWAL